MNSIDKNDSMNSIVSVIDNRVVSNLLLIVK